MKNVYKYFIYSRLFLLIFTGYFYVLIHNIYSGHPVLIKFALFSLSEVEKCEFDPHWVTSFFNRVKI